MKPAEAIMDALGLQERRDLARLACEIGRTPRYLDQNPTLRKLLEDFGLIGTDYDAPFPSLRGFAA